MVYDDVKSSSAGAGNTTKTEHNALEVFQNFRNDYEGTFVRVEYYLKEVVENVPPYLASAYQSWYKAAHDLIRGVYCVTKEIPIAHAESLKDAIHLFTYDSAIQFLRDICISCGMRVNDDWCKALKENMHQLKTAFEMLVHQQKQAPTFRL